MAYIDPQDIIQHKRGLAQVPVPNLQEIMGEIEYFVSIRLDLNPLPPNNPLLKNIIRELSTSRAILDLLPPQAENLNAAVLHEQRGFKLLAEAKANGIEPVDYSTKDYTKEVYVPPEYPAWTSEDFLP